MKYTDPDGRECGLLTDSHEVFGAGHSALYVEMYDKNGNTTGFAVFEVNPLNDNAIKHGGAPLDLRFAVLIGKIGGSSVGGLVGTSSGSTFTGSSVGSSKGSTIVSGANEGNFISVGVNEYHFATKEQLLAFIKENKFDRVASFDTTVSQDRAIYKEAIAAGDSFGRYELFTNNCIQYASRVLEAV